MTVYGQFPFGQPVLDVVQTDRTPKKVFVLGVYSSAVHARWVSPTGKTIVNALAVASEPDIFWRGDGADALIEQIRVPQELGKLVPANPQFNGPSGIVLDEFILHPLGLERSSAWLCDLVPHSCVNPSQAAAIERAYLPKVRPYELPEPSVPTLPGELTDAARRQEIFDELNESYAETLILLGDLPIRWFLQYFEPRWKKLSDFDESNGGYGKLHLVSVSGKMINVLPLAHPRQIARLGKSSIEWYDRHQVWLKQDAGKYDFHRW